MQDDEGVDENQRLKPINTTPSNLGSLILGHSKRLMNFVVREIGGFYNNKVNYTDTDSAYIHENHWSTLVDSGSVGDGVGMGENDYVDSCIFYAWFLAPKIKYCLVINDQGVISAKQTFIGYSEEHSVKNLKSLYCCRGEKQFVVGFCQIGQRHVKALKSHIVSNVVWNVKMQKFGVIVTGRLK